MSLIDTANTIYSELQLRLEELRLDFSKIHKYNFDVNVNKHFDRAGICLAIYNDFKHSDYQIVKQILNEEFEFHANYQVCWNQFKYQISACDPLYHYHYLNIGFMVFVLCLFRQPESIELVWAFKCLSMDFGTLLDIDYLLMSGNENVQRFIDNANDEFDVEIKGYLQECLGLEFTVEEERIESFISICRERFNRYKFPFVNLEYILNALGQFSVLNQLRNQKLI